MKHQGLIRPYQNTLDLIARILDSGWIALTMYVACRFYGKHWENHESVAVAAAVALFYLVGQAIGLYRSARGEPLKVEIYRVYSAWAIVATLLLLLVFATKTSTAFSRIVTIIWFFTAPIAISMWRLFLGLALQELRSLGFNLRKAAVVGVSAPGNRAARAIVASPWMGLDFVGFYDDRVMERLPDFEPELGELNGHIDQLIETAKNGDVDVVYIALPPRAEARIAHLLRELSDTTCSVYVVFDLGGFELIRPQWTNLGNVPVLGMVENPFLGVDGWIKRVEDVVIGMCIMAMIALPMAIIAIAVKLSSRGPVLFRQRRYGLDGKEIQVLKFRTMTVCEDGDKIVQATKNDARITRLGAFLRRTSMDELPQFLQVLTGEMSIVGPRPHAVAHNEEYRKMIPGYMLRHKVKPGITGWAQVNGWRGETNTLDKMRKRVECDITYIRNWTPALDLKIIYLTVFGVAARRNAR